MTTNALSPTVPPDAGAPTYTTDPDALVLMLDSLPPEGEKLMLGTVTPKGGFVPTDPYGPAMPVYVNTGSFIKTRERRAKAENVEHCLFLMLDDVGTKATKTLPIEPTWKIETSPGNFQWGYAWEPTNRPTKGAQAAAVKALAAAGYSDPGASGAVRWCRLPGSVKPGGDFAARLVEFHPERRFTLEQLLASAVGLPAVPDTPGFEPIKVKDDGTDDVLAWLSKRGEVLSGPTGDGWYEVKCPDAHEHSDGRAGARYLPSTRAFKCMHSHGENWNSNRFLELVAARGGPAHQYGVRNELLFGAQPGESAQSAQSGESAQSEQSPQHGAPGAVDYMTKVFAATGVDLARWRGHQVMPVGDDGFAIKLGDDGSVIYRRGAHPARQGNPAPQTFGASGDSSGSELVYVVDCWLSAVALHDATGAHVVCVEDWAFGQVQFEDGGMDGQLHTDLLRLARPGVRLRAIATRGNEHDKHWRQRMGMFRLLMQESGADVRCHAMRRSMHIGTALNARYGGRSAWPKGDELTKALFGKKHGLMETLPDDEMAEAAQAYTTSNADRFGNYHLDLTDRGAGSLILSLLGRGSFFYLEDRKEWVWWKEGAWRSLGAVPMPLVNVAALHYLKRGMALKEQAKAIRKEKGEKDPTYAAKVAESSAYLDRSTALSKKARLDVIKDLQARPEVQSASGEFDRDGWLLGVKNGVLDLRTGKVREATREDRILRRCPVNYVRGATHPKITKLLNEITALPVQLPNWMGGGVGFDYSPERQRWNQRRLGAMLIGANGTTSLEIRHGAGANGKTVLVNLMGHVLGDTAGGVGEMGYLCTVPAAAIMTAYHGRDPDAATPALAAAVGARVLVMSESKDTDKLNEQLVKNITGGDRIAYRALYKGAASFKPQFTPLLITNTLPHVVEGSKAIWDRLSPMEFKMRWARANRQAQGDEDAGLPPEDTWFRDDVAQDTAALEAFFAWLVDGCLDFQRDPHVKAPDDIRATMKAYRDASDSFEAWRIDKRLELKHGEFAASGFLYASFREWCATNGNQAPAATVFVRRLLERYPSLSAGKQNGVRGISGICAGAGGVAPGAV